MPYNIETYLQFLLEMESSNETVEFDWKSSVHCTIDHLYNFYPYN